MKQQQLKAWVAAETLSDGSIVFNVMQGNEEIFNALTLKGAQEFCQEFNSLCPEGVPEDCEYNLKPCPFCGGRATLRRTPQGGVFVDCDDCNASSKLVYGDKTDPKPIAVEAWNERGQGRAAAGHRVNAYLENCRANICNAIKQIQTDVEHGQPCSDNRRDLIQAITELDAFRHGALQNCPQCSYEETIEGGP